MDTLVKYKTAKLAKEKGFKHNSKCYGGNGEILENIENHTNNMMQRFRYEAPTQSQLQKWLLDNNSIFVTVNIAYNDFRKYAAEVWGEDDSGKSKLLIDGFNSSIMTIYDNPYSAFEEGLQKALKLI